MHAGLTAIKAHRNGAAHARLSSVPCAHCAHCAAVQPAELRCSKSFDALTADELRQCGEFFRRWYAEAVTPGSGACIDSMEQQAARASAPYVAKESVMNQRATYLVYEPHGPGLMCAVVVLVDGENVYGWYTGPSRGGFVASFFMLERYYSMHEATFYHSVSDDVYDDWVIAYPPTEIVLGNRSPLPEGVSNALASAQAAFAAEWLCYSDDPGAAADIEWYRARNLPLVHAGIRCEKLPKLAAGPVTWVYASPALDQNIIDFLRKRWPLDFALAS